tara:strand:- start:343 stop:492 length:150 start_codon:yes stop_codon:yes gene_type:complete
LASHEAPLLKYVYPGGNVGGGGDGDGGGGLAGGGAEGKSSGAMRSAVAA